MARDYNVTIAACFVAALLGGVVYLNALHNPFVYDDYHTVVENPSIAHVTDIRGIVLGALTRPVVNLSYAVDRAVWGDKPLGFHVTNVLLHMVNVVLLFQLARQFGSGDFTAFAGAALFAVHPMMSEAVGYISGRSEVLCATLFILAIMSGRRWLAGRLSKDRSYMWPVLTITCWFAALATKESAAMFPFVFLAYDWLGGSGADTDRRRRLLTIHLPLVGTAVLLGIVRLAVLARVEYAGITGLHWNYVLLEMDVVRRYLWMLLIPSGQAIFHEVAAVSLFDPRVWLAMLVLGALLALGWRLRGIDWTVSFGIVWFLLLLVPSSVLIALDQGEPMAEHRVYLASCGLFWAGGASMGWLATRKPRFVAGGIALVVISFGAETMLRNAVWRDPVSLWRESVDLAPAHYRPRLLLGEALQEAGRRDEALEQYRTAVRLRPSEPAGYVKIGQCLAEMSQWNDARLHFLKAMEIDPQNLSARNSLTVLDRMERQLGIDDHR